MKHLLDTSALVVHALAGPGAGEVQALLADEEHEIIISPLSLFELAGVLKQCGVGEHIRTCWETYRAVARVIPVDAGLAMAAWELRGEIGARIPIADALIAATARAAGAILVHNDRHLAQIPETLVPQIRLSAR